MSIFNFDNLAAQVARMDPASTQNLKLRAGFEIREIVIATGKGFRNDELEAGARLPSNLLLPPDQRTDHPAIRDPAKPALPLVTTDGTTYQMLNSVQGVIFNIRVITQKDEFRNTLATEGVHLIYSGHSRLGRGSCFGSAGALPEEEWEEGGNPAGAGSGVASCPPNPYPTGGAFRHGYRYVIIPVGDITDHKYTANLVPASVPLPSTTESHPRVHRFARTTKTLAQISAEVGQDITPYVRNYDPSDPGKLYHYYRSALSRSSFEPHVVLYAGWKETTSDPYDLQATEVKCRCLSLLSCSTREHFHKVIRQQYAWTKGGNNHYAYFTQDPVVPHIASFLWLYHVLTYNKPNAYASWEPSLEYARVKTTRDMARGPYPTVIF